MAIQHTPRLALPYPDGNEAFAPDTHIKDLAESLDAILPSVTQLNTGTGTGDVALTTDLTVRTHALTNWTAPAAGIVEFEHSATLVIASSSAAAGVDGVVISVNGVEVANRVVNFHTNSRAMQLGRHQTAKAAVVAGDVVSCQYRARRDPASQAVVVMNRTYEVRFVES